MTSDLLGLYWNHADSFYSSIERRASICVSNKEMSDLSAQTSFLLRSFCETPKECTRTPAATAESSTELTPIADNDEVSFHTISVFWGLFLSKWTIVVLFNLVKNYNLKCTSEGWIWATSPHYKAPCFSVSGGGASKSPENILWLYGPFFHPGENLSPRYKDLMLSCFFTPHVQKKVV